ncbi:phospholipase, partial [Salmonella enterica subsp. enterica]|nr:phospholipase [Salmonella enterica subsp. enterica serovar Bovismorbificans]
LERYCDLKLVNDVNRMKVSVSAVNVRNGNFAIFSNENEELRYDHFIASGALPPGFPAVEIDGEYYWDGGLVSNTPLNEILSHEEHLKQLIFQVDLWNAKGTVPENMMEIDERIKDIQYSSKTRMVTDFMAQKLRYTRLIKELLEIIDDDAKVDKVEELCVNKAREMT